MLRNLLFLFLLSPILLQSQTVYKTPSGKKYHTENCRTVKNTSTAISVTEALQIGLEPCKICRPSAGSVQRFASDGNTVSGEKNTTTQCLGTTKKGTRCKHRTKIANGYCFQHQPES